MIPLIKKIAVSPYFQFTVGIAALISFQLQHSNPLVLVISVPGFVTIAAFFHIKKYYKSNYYSKTTTCFSKYREVSKIQVHICSKLITKDAELRRKIDQGKSNNFDYFETMRTIQFDYYKQIVELLKDFLQILARQDGIDDVVSISIKHLFKENGENDDINVVTIWRDRNSYYSGRSVGEDSKATISNNYDFLNIYNVKDESKKCFVHNNLSEYDDYFNSNAGWQKDYNATIVVPIEWPKRRNGIVGFLCADSLNSDKKNIFNKKSLEIMKSFAALIASQLIMLESLSKDVLNKVDKENGININDKALEALIWKKSKES